MLGSVQILHNHHLGIGVDGQGVHMFGSIRQVCTKYFKWVYLRGDFVGLGCGLGGPRWVVMNMLWGLLGAHPEDY